MAINILMPALSPTMTEGKLAKWHVKEGDKITSGQVICEIETDKATMEVEAVDEGIIGKLLVAEGTEAVAVNAPIAILVEEGEAVPAAKPAPQPAAPAAPPPAAPSPAPAQSAPAVPPRPAAAPAPAARADGQRIFASPLARRIAADARIDLARVSGSGPHGRIVKADVEAARSAGTAAAAPKPAAAAPAPAAPQPVYPAGETRKVPHNSIRKVIAKRLTEAKQQIPHIYLTVDYEIDALLAARQAINAVGEKARIKVSVNDMVIKACAQALRDHPEVNASWTDTDMILNGTVDISVAVATDRGLITPIVRNADLKGVGRIATEMKDLAARAREGKLKLDEFQGGGFTISNMGMYGIKDFAAVINPPQACILAVGAGEQRVVVRDGQMVIRTIMSCTLSADHRIVDGSVGAQFLQTLKGYIEQPAAMLL
ncbi:pyruvate dehydrogenase complex dihydrolipoamide acetyltransferase [Vineibacter terrae]|uniref:Acetyltransferase component of pyruvate dehydrogenase complex n=1 Tax=Vineibacter terrae TaxID=2586908 RepID=A0A5C8PF27_9HYPH|nr:pyruvate dehydrogenase complex dihydrolipoamide acetyltransferase [Vineibacter terrae]TXL72216.1 pyruvate dehydrogenase complex dihydrolipoamide acetyltransferase [Vineibacter terrae]